MAVFAAGDRVRVVARFRGMHRCLRRHMELGHEARVLRVSRTSPTRMLLRFDETDAMYGLHWVSPDVVEPVVDMRSRAGTPGTSENPARRWGR